ncbi:MAG TPA: hypothetical protein VD811_13520 [Desulfuromonadales bacterium]|nr:hypothetical protein [Desulfuromonadales bacterium]
MIDLFAGTVLLGISVLLFLVLRWGSRKPQEPIWMRDALVANVYTPLLVGTLAFGTCYLIKFAAVLGS